jgi:TatD DNase family protein
MSTFPPIEPHQFATAPTGVELFDSHCHLAGGAFDSDLPAVLQRAQAAGVRQILVIGAGAATEQDPLAGNGAAQKLCKQHPQLHLAVGLHPHEADFWQPQTETNLKSLIEDSPRPKAIGEIGLDYHYNYSTPENQRRAFAAQLALAVEYQLPFLVHTRSAHQDTLAILREQQKHILAVGGLIHCFSEGPDEAHAYLQLGLHLSFSGVVTFAKSTAVREALKFVPLDRLLLETDAPFLAPPPFRGKRCEPANMLATAERVAMERGITLPVLSEATYRNACRLLRLS